MRIRRMTEAAAKQRYPQLFEMLHAPYSWARKNYGESVDLSSEIDSLTDTKHLEIASKNGFWSRLFGGGQR